jgi:hypothetical protein
MRPMHFQEAKEVELKQKENILKEKEVSSMHFKFPRKLSSSYSLRS